MVLLAFVLVTAPEWADEVELRPAGQPEISLNGTAPYVLLPADDFASLTVSGPSELVLEFRGLATRAGTTGRVSLMLDNETVDRVALSRPPIRGKRKFRAKIITRPVRVRIPIPAGEHLLTLRPSSRLRGGYLLRTIEVQDQPDDEPDLVVAPAGRSDEPDLESGIAQDTSADTSEVALPPSTTAPDTSEPPLITEVSAATLDGEEPGFTVVAPRPEPVTVTSPDGVELFMHVTTEVGFHVQATGPGTLIFDFHAHRSDKHPETLEPVIVGLLRDDILVETLKVEQPADARYSRPDSSWKMSDRAYIQLAIPTGSHDVDLTLSDNASLGSSVRGRFEYLELKGWASTLPSPPEAPPIFRSTAKGARAGRVSETTTGSGETREARKQSSFSFALGAARSNATGAVGPAMLLGATFPTPALETRLALRLEGGARWTKSEDEGVEVREVVVPAAALLGIELLRSPITISLFAGGGTLIYSAKTRWQETDLSTGWRISPALAASLRIQRSFDLGTVGLNVGGFAARPSDARNLRDYDSGALSVALEFQH